MQSGKEPVRGLHTTANGHTIPDHGAARRTHDDRAHGDGTTRTDATCSAPAARAHGSIGLTHFNDNIRTECHDGERGNQQQAHVSLPFI